MKKHIVSLAVLTAFAAPAMAQNSVTLYGLIDEGFDFTNNVLGSHQYELQSGLVQGSRWGLKGVEDLGSGLKAVFQLENGFNVNNGRLGQGGLMFGRQAYVGLASDRYGTVTFGRQYDSVVDFLAPATANGSWGGLLFSHPYDNDNTDNTFRVNNTVKYTSPDLSGLRFGGTYSFSNSTGFANNRQYSLGGQYTSGGLLVAAAYLQANNPSATAGGAIGNGGDTDFVASRLRIFGGGVNYTFGPATAGFVYTNTDVRDPTANGYLNQTVTGETIAPITGPLAGATVGSIRFQNFEINGKYQLTPALYLGAQYVYTLERYSTTLGTAKPRIHSFGLMADYNLSKRTDIYIQGAYQRVAGDSTGSSLDQAYVPGAADLSGTSRQVVGRVGLRHKF
ncbi:porin [Trinickia caryophylli]|uniref:Outer membrane protein (Porin) n=1 Tax=Trinickia caryophylli TaxID=28094 RepID=A0A1X7CVJ6_TRICW|nr:porin [Trinickia caryophylli]PMS13418.1 porin [Trinickia caryophylli]TRX13723.1 porin [Trinickia caryophylli]WQE15311.1 porin [Trinickia caryophylli]SMF03970.1 Outer membrane protein (porin) [Trinickia caryophylli]GLU30935.1 membrane protein [Trinickia caryophylli]